MQNAHSAQCLALNKCRIYSFIKEIFNEYVTWGRQCSRGWDAVQIPASMLLPIYCPLLTCHRLQMVMTAVENMKAGEGGNRHTGPGADLELHAYSFHHSTVIAQRWPWIMCR